MTIVTLMKYYGIALVVFLGIDMVWLSVVAKNFYATHLGYLMRPKPLIAPALIFYLIDVVAIVVFAVYPSVHNGTFGKAIMLGALLGLVTYATYDLTNYATIKDWPIIVVIVDIIWGTLLTAAVSGITWSIIKRFGL